MTKLDLLLSQIEDSSPENLKNKSNHKRGHSKKQSKIKLEDLLVSAKSKHKRMMSRQKSSSKSRNYSDKYAKKLFNRLHNSNSSANMIKHIRQSSHSRPDFNLLSIPGLTIPKPKPMKKYSKLKQRKLNQSRQLSIAHSKERLQQKHLEHTQKVRRTNLSL